MTWPIQGFDVAERLDFATGRVSKQDADRQVRTVIDVLRRLAERPGAILADEVGMGKTFVALGVAVAAALGDKGRRPVVVMVPSSLHEKWPRDFQVFANRVLRSEKDRAFRIAQAGSALEFFRLIDDVPSKRAQVIFIKHGAFHTNHIDHWVRLALIKRAMHGMHLGERRSALPRFAATLLRTKTKHRDPELYDRLLGAPYDRWLEVINAYYDDPQDRLVDDPVPLAVQKVLESSDLQLDALKESLRALPARVSDTIEARLENLRRAINEALADIWPRTIAQARFRSPLLILDEAHHLKNPATRLASLFVEPDAAEEADTIAGALQGAFERMLFLTATPFQLGHRELLNVIDRFAGIDWKSLPSYTREQFDADRRKLSDALDGAQQRAADLDDKWQGLRLSDVASEGTAEPDLDAWWSSIISQPEAQPERIQSVLRAYGLTRTAMKEAEALLRQWVLRHLRDRRLPDSDIARRVRLPGRGLQLDGDGGGEGLAVGGEALLPFLLAARAQAVVVRDASNGRATFAEGLASSYEAFLETRKANDEENPSDEIEKAPCEESSRVNRYLAKLQSALPDESAYARHPKVSALVDRVTDLWGRGEKVVIFCHYRATGRALVRHLSASVEARLWADAERRLGLKGEELRRQVDAFGQRFDARGGMRQPLDDFIDGRLKVWSALSDSEREQIRDVIRRFVRTPIFVARYFDVQGRSSEAVLEAALATQDASGAPLREKIDQFLRFIAERCEEKERANYLEALHHVQPGSRGERPLDDEERNARDKVELMPNVRLANGGIRQETRQRLLLSFNTPFFPEILVASSVLAEGVDLHLNCRYMIHHDLSWNPSTLEQRTGRVDRMGAKAEWVKKPIEVFVPYVAATQDEKQYRVVMDRERWFQVLMGEEYRTDEAFTEKIAERVPLPHAAASALAFDLAVR